MISYTKTPQDTVSHDLIDFIYSSTNEIENEYKRIQKRVTEDPGTAGDQGEENWATLLKNWLPPNFHIKTKGRILSHKGVASPQVDVIVLKPEYPEKLLDKKLYLAGGVLAAFECKVTLKSKHIEEFISNSVEISNHLEVRKGTPYKELNKGLLYGLLAHSHSWKEKNSKPIDLIGTKLQEQDQEKVTHPIQMPDIICVADLATWNSTKITYIGPQQIPGWNKGMANHYSPKGNSTSGYVCHSKATENQVEAFSPLGTLITSLLKKLAWEYPNLRSIANYFNATNIQGSGAGKLRMWESSIYSDEIRNRVEKGQLVNGKTWDEWSVYF